MNEMIPSLLWILNIQDQFTKKLTSEFLTVHFYGILFPHGVLHNSINIRVDCLAGFLILFAVKYPAETTKLITTCHIHLGIPESFAELFLGLPLVGLQSVDGLAKQKRCCDVQG